MLYSGRLREILQKHLSWNKARLDFMARFTIALTKLATARLPKLALTLNPSVKSASNYRRMQRFLASYSFDFEAFGHLLTWLLPEREELVAVLDRTEWHFGKTPLNVLMIGIAYRGIAFPVVWKVLPEGASGRCFRKVVPAVRTSANGSCAAS